MNEIRLTQLKDEVERLEKKNVVNLPALGSWPDSVHQFDEESKNALKMALAAQRPLLLRGDPGTGKSQLARAAAVALGRLFVYEVVNAHMESQDLIWRFDAVGRLAEAQCLQGRGDEKVDIEKALEFAKYVSPGVLWWALSWDIASKVYNNSTYKISKPDKPEGWQQEKGSVVLIDEIDKANTELPNGLLEILGNNSINLPFLNTTIGSETTTPPLVIITTNEERELPNAFVRRCLVLNLEFPDKEGPFIEEMLKRGGLHFGTKCSADVRREAAEQLWQDREKAMNRGDASLPGQAEYLDMLRALSLLGQTEKEQRNLLKQAARFAFDKYPKRYGQ